MGRLKIVLVFAILTIAPLISESLLGTGVTMESIFNFDVCLSHVNSCLHLSKK